MRLRTLAVAAALAASLLARPAGARPAVSIAEFTDAQGRRKGADQPRDEIYLAIQRADRLDLINFSRVKAAAARKGVRPADLARPAKLGQVAYSVGADAVVTGNVARGQLQVRIYDSMGKEIWEKLVRLERGDLPRGMADRFAAAIAAAVEAVPGAGTPHVEPEPVKPPVVEVPTERVPTEKVREPETPPPPKPKEPEPVRVVEVPKPRPKPSEPPKPEIPVPVPETPETDKARPALFNLQLSVMITWRNYRFCPEVSNCDQTPPVNAGAPVKYSTEKPYGGLLLSAELFPLHDRDDLLRGFALAGSFGRSLFLKTHYIDLDGADHSFSSVEQRASAEALWRIYYRLGDAGDGFVGLRGGYRWHWFLVDENPRIVDSSRAGLFGGIEGAFPLHRFLRIEGTFLGIPFANPGAKERAAYGATASGGGFAVSGGFASDFGDPGYHLGAAATFDYVHYGDRFANEAGVHPEFGRGLEDYIGVHFGLRTFF